MRVAVSVLLTIPVLLLVVMDVVWEVEVSVSTALDVVSKSATVVEVVMAFVVDACFQTPQSGQPPCDTSREWSQLLNASVMPLQPAKLNKDETPITLAARQ